jgi:hypothetical protein
MSFINFFHKWRKRRIKVKALREARTLPVDDQHIEFERRSAIPIDATDFASLPDRYIRDLRYADTWF